MADRTISDLIREDSSGAAPVESTAAAGPELGRIKANVAKMIEQGAPEHDIDAYIAGEALVRCSEGIQPKPESWATMDMVCYRRLARARPSAMVTNLLRVAGAVGNKVMRGVGVDVPELEL